MGNQLSQEAYPYVFGSEFVVSTAIYHVLFWRVYTFFEKHRGKTPKECLLIATNTISTLHSVLMLSAYFDFFHYRRWEKPTIDEPKLAGHIWAIGTGYMTADLLGHLICFRAYSAGIIPRRWDIVAHHLIIILWWFICMWPRFVYAWSIFSVIYCVELTTIFLNLQWFGKHFKHERLQKVAGFLFALTWFPVRPPIVIWCLYWVIKYWQQINRDLPLRAVVYIMLSFVLMVPLQLGWTALIIWKLIHSLCANFKSKSAPKPPHALHGFSVEF